MRIPEVPLMKF